MKRTHGMFVVLTAGLLCAAALAGQKPAPAKQLSPLQGAAINPANTDSGFYFGANWMMSFTAPHDWPDDIQAARALGVIGVVHPKHWDARKFAPVIYVAMDQRTAKVHTLQDEMQTDVRETRRNDPETRVTAGPPLADASGSQVPVRIFENGRNWQEVAYLDEPPVFFMVTLRCVSASACRPLLPAFARYVKSLNYSGNVKIIDHAPPPAPSQPR